MPPGRYPVRAGSRRSPNGRGRGPGAAGGRVQKAEQHPDRRALARAVGTKEAEDLAFVHVQGNAVEGADGHGAAMAGHRTGPVIFISPSAVITLIAARLAVPGEGRARVRARRGPGRRRGTSAALRGRPRAGTIGTCCFVPIRGSMSSPGACRRARPTSCSASCVAPRSRSAGSCSSVPTWTTARPPTTPRAAARPATRGLVPKSEPVRILSLARERDVTWWASRRRSSSTRASSARWRRSGGAGATSSPAASTPTSRAALGAMPQLLALSDEITMLSAICVVCGEAATRTQRLVGGRPAAVDDPLIVIGGYDAPDRDLRGALPPPPRGRPRRFGPRGRRRRGLMPVYGTGHASAAWRTDSSIASVLANAPRARLTWASVAGASDSRITRQPTAASGSHSPYPRQPAVRSERASGGGTGVTRGTAVPAYAPTRPLTSSTAAGLSVCPTPGRRRG